MNVSKHFKHLKASSTKCSSAFNCNFRFQKRNTLYMYLFPKNFNYNRMYIITLQRDNKGLLSRRQFIILVLITKLSTTTNLRYQDHRISREQVPVVGWICSFVDTSLCTKHYTTDQLAIRPSVAKKCGCKITDKKSNYVPTKFDFPIKTG